MNIARHTAVDWAYFCREVAVDLMMEFSVPIGGYDRKVDIDETCVWHT
jgi:hypothetical protein